MCAYLYIHSSRRQCDSYTKGTEPSWRILNLFVGCCYFWRINIQSSSFLWDCYFFYFLVYFEDWRSIMEYYSVLGVGTDASDEEIRRAYRKLAMQWHPDKWIKAPSHLMEAKQKFQQIQEAYGVLSDRQKRMLYDAGLYDLDDDEDEVEGFTDFLGEMVSLMNDARKEEKNYSIEELQSMFWEMAQDFETPQWTTVNMQQHNYNGMQCSYGPFSNFYDFGTAKSDSLGANMMMQGDSHFKKMNFQTYGAHQCCR